MVVYMILFQAEKRQTLRTELEEQGDRGEEEENKGKAEVVDVVHLVEAKSKFLLQFAGLSRVALKSEVCSKSLCCMIHNRIFLEIHSVITTVDYSMCNLLVREKVYS